MKKYFSIDIFTIMMAALTFLSSCGEDDLIPDDNQEQVMMEWTEPFHTKNSSVEDIKAYMASSMKSYRLVAETSTTENTQLAYSTSNPNVGGFGQGDAEIVLQDPLRVQGLLFFFASVILAQVFLVLKKKQFEKVQLYEMNF